MSVTTTWRFPVPVEIGGRRFYLAGDPPFCRWASPMPTRVVNKRTTRPREGDVFIGRPSVFGNPFKAGPDGTRDEVLAKYKAYFIERLDQDPAFRAAVEALRGKRLVCWCVPLPCHGQIIADWLEQQNV